MSVAFRIVATTLAGATTVEYDYLPHYPTPVSFGDSVDRTYPNANGALYVKDYSVKIEMLGITYWLTRGYSRAYS